MSTLVVPDPSLVVLVGPGTSAFARRHFAADAVLAGDALDAVGERLAGGRIAVVDAAGTGRESRAALLGPAREHHVPAVAIVLDPRGALGGLTGEGFRRVHVLSSPEEVDAARVEVVPLPADRRGETGPFDVVGDVHGCREELEELLDRLGYALHRDAAGRTAGAHHPEGRRAVFVGDLVDRGPDVPGVLRLAMGMVAAGDALCVRGNHEDKLGRALAGRDVQVTHGLERSLTQLAGEPDGFRAEVRAFCTGLGDHYVLDGGRLVVAHAGLPERFHGRESGAVRAHALYGERTGETDEHGLPVRGPWAFAYRGAAAVVYGHTPVLDAVWVNGTICLDTGAVFGGALTALRWPERTIVSVAARRTWYEPKRPLAPVALPPPVVEPGGSAEPSQARHVLPS